MLVHEFLEQTAARHPDKPALICDGKRLSYVEVEALANRMAGALVASGVRRGDRVAIHLGNSVEAVVGIYGALKAGAAFVLIHPTTKAAKLVRILNNCRATVLLAGASSPWFASTQPPASLVPSLNASIRCGAPGDKAAMPGQPPLEFEALIARFPPAPPPCRGIDLDLACLIYTSGSTGEPKGVMSDHSNVVFAAQSIIQYLGNNENDIVLNVLPLSFDYGLYQILMTFMFGGTLVLEKSFAYPAAILKRIEQERATGFPGVPTMFALLVNLDLSGFDLSSLRYLTNTAAALPPAHTAQIRKKFPRARLFSMYGLTETKRTLYLPPEQLDHRPDSVGIPIPGTECWIEDAQGNRLGAGEIGELVVRGRHVMRGYWEDPELTARRFRPGQLPGERLCYTGDLFRMDQDGYFYFVGRSDDLIKSRGQKVAPKEIENVLYELPEVAAAAVIGVADPVLGQAIKAILVLRPGAGLESNQVLAHCRTRLEDHLVPQQIEFRESLAVSDSGKIRKPAVSVVER